MQWDIIQGTAEKLSSHIALCKESHMQCDVIMQKKGSDAAIPSSE